VMSTHATAALVNAPLTLASANRSANPIERMVRLIEQGSPTACTVSLASGATRRFSRDANPRARADGLGLVPSGAPAIPAGHVLASQGESMTLRCQTRWACHPRRAQGGAAGFSEVSPPVRRKRGPWPSPWVGARSANWVSHRRRDAGPWSRPQLRGVRVVRCRAARSTRGQ
jgi:hypothetical protein